MTIRSLCFHIEHPMLGIAFNGSAWSRTSASSVGKKRVERYDAWRHVANVLLMCC